MPRERQVEFPKEQSHHPLVAPVCWIISVVCIVIVIILTATDTDGPFIGPW